MNFSDILNDYAPYKGIVENLNNTPVSVAGIVESAQGQLIYSLKNENKSSALVVCYSDMEARKLYSDMELYSDNVLYFPTKEYIFYNIETSGHQNEHARISVIQKLVSGGDYIVVTSLDAMLMYGKEASNRKQEIDRQHYTIPNQRPKDKHCGKI